MYYMQMSLTNIINLCERVFTHTGDEKDIKKLIELKARLEKDRLERIEQRKLDQHMAEKYKENRVMIGTFVKWLFFKNYSNAEQIAIGLEMEKKKVDYFIFSKSPMYAEDFGSLHLRQAA